MRVLFDARYIRTDFHDGISRFSASLAAATAVEAEARGDEIAYLIHDDAQRRLLPAGGRVLRIHAPTSPLEPFTALILNRYRPDVVFSAMQTIGSLGRRFGLILTLHDTIYYRHRTPPRDLPMPVRIGWRIFHLSYWPQRLVLNAADAVATVSETSRRQFAAVRLTRRPVHVLANAPQRLGELLPGETRRDQDAASDALGGVSGAAFSDAPGASPQEPVADSGLPPRNIVYMGSFMPYKNVETIVRGMAGLPDHTLHLLSRISESRRREYEAMAPAGARIVFHNGVSDAEYAALLADRAVLATLSLDEGYGMPIAEALAFGVPAVVSDLEIFHEVAGDGALFVPARDPDAFAAAVRALDDDARRADLVAAGRRHSAGFTWERTARSLLDAASGVVAARRSRRSRRSG